MLQLFKLDFAGKGNELPPAGKAVAAPDRFHKLSWGTFGSNTQDLPV